MSVNTTTIYTTVDNGMTHIAQGSAYVGAVSSYNNCITRLFARIFGWAEKVQDAKGNSRYFEKGSYLAFLQNYTEHKDAQLANLKNYNDLRRLNIRQNPHMGLMRNAVSRNKSDKLFRKLAYALHNGKVTQAMRYVGKGADIDSTFWERGKFGITFGSFKANLAHNAAVDVQATLYTPLLFSADRHNNALTTFLMAFKPNTSIQGEEYAFSRKIKQVSTNTVPIMNFDRGFGRHARPRMHMDLYQQTNVLTEDEERPLHLLRFDPQTQGIQRSAHPGRAKSTPHMHQENASVMRVI